METNFAKKIPSKLPPDELWDQVCAALQDSAGHPFWPTDLEQVKSTRFHANGLIHVIYKGFLRSTAVTYRIVSLQPNQRTIEYESTGNHPLDGGATVHITRGGKGGSELHWAGSYIYPWYSPMGTFLPYFLSRFFKKLRANLRLFESEKIYKNQYAKVHNLAERRMKRSREAR